MTFQLCSVILKNAKACSKEILPEWNMNVSKLVQASDYLHMQAFFRYYIAFHADWGFDVCLVLRSNAWLCLFINGGTGMKLVWCVSVTEFWRPNDWLTISTPVLTTPNENLLFWLLACWLTLRIIWAVCLSSRLIWHHIIHKPNPSYGYESVPNYQMLSKLSEKWNHWERCVFGQTHVNWHE